MFVGKLDYSVGRGLWYAVEGGLYVYMSGITLTLAFFSSSAAVVTMSVTLANYCLMKIHRPYLKPKMKCIDTNNENKNPMCAMGAKLVSVFRIQRRAEYEFLWLILGCL